MHFIVFKLGTIISYHLTMVMVIEDDIYLIAYPVIVAQKYMLAVRQNE